MNEGCGELTAVLNSNTKKTLDKLLEEVKIYLATKVLILGDDVYLQFEHPSVSDDKNVPGLAEAPFKLKFNMGGACDIGATISCSGSSDVRGVGLYIYINGKDVGYASSSTNGAVEVKVRVNVEKDDLMSFKISGASQESTAGMAANSLKVYGKVVKLATRGLMEVIE